MSEVPPPKLNHANSPVVLGILVLFGRGFIYALAFWTVYRALIWIYPPIGSSAESYEMLQQRQTSQLNVYDEQSRKA